MRRKGNNSVNMVVSGHEFEQWIDEQLTGTFGREVVWTFKGVPNYNNMEVKVTVESYVEPPVALEEGWEDEWD